MVPDPVAPTDGRLPSIFAMLDLLKCVSCSHLPLEQVFFPGPCCHKYCKPCIEKLANKDCIVCQAKIDPKERVEDSFSTNLIAQLLKLQRSVDPDSEYPPKKSNASNDEPPTIDMLAGNEFFRETGKNPFPDEPEASKAEAEIEPKILQRNPSSKSKGKKNTVPLLPKKISEPIINRSEEEENLSKKQSRDPSPSKDIPEEVSKRNISKAKKPKKGSQGKDKKEQKPKPRKAKTYSEEESLTGEILARLFNSSDEEDEEQLPSLTPHPPSPEKKRLTALNSKSSIQAGPPKEKPKLEVQVSLERIEIESPTTRSRTVANNAKAGASLINSKTGFRSRRKLSEEFKAPANKKEKKDTKGQSSTERPTFLKPEPLKGLKGKELKEDPKRIFTSRSRSRSTSVYSASDEEEAVGRNKLLKKEDESAADDIYDFQSQSKKIVPKKGRAKATKATKATKAKPKRQRLDSDLSDSSTASSMSVRSNVSNVSKISVKKEVLETPKSAKGTKGSSGANVSTSNVSMKSSPSMVHKRNAKGETPLHIAVRTGKLDRVRDLIEKGGEVDAKDYAGWAPLHEAVVAKAPTLEMIQLLCDSGADVNALGMNNETPLHEASRLGLGEIVQYLLEQGASPAIRNTSGKLPKDCSKEDDIREIFTNHEEEMKGQSQSIDLSVELKVSLQKAVIYFAYNVSKDLLKNAKTLWDFKISSELNKKVTHVIFDAKPKTKVQLNFDFLLAILNGNWILSSKWLEDSLSVKRFLDPRKYQLSGCVYDNVPSSTGDDVAVERARINRELGYPSLFQGMNFYIYKNTNWPTNVKGGKSTISLSKKDIGKLIEFGNGVVTNREPNPDLVDPFESLQRFHARQDEDLTSNSSSSIQDHKLTLTSHLILYDDKNVPPVKHDLEHVKTLKIDWLIHSAVHFRLLHPDSYL